MEMLLESRWTARERTMTVRNPEDGSVVDTVPQASAEDMERAVAAAARAAEVARTTPVHARMAALAGAAGILEREAESFAVSHATCTWRKRGN